MVLLAIRAGVAFVMVAICAAPVMPACAQEAPANPMGRPPAHFSASPALAPTPTPMPAHPADDVLDGRGDGHDRMTVPVRIEVRSGTHGPFAFLVDTGSERTVIARSVAQAAGLVPVEQAVLVGVAGYSQVDLVMVDTIDLGRRSLYGVKSPLLDAHDIGADGIVGIDGLQGQRVLLDFDHKRMAIGDARTLGGNTGYDIVVTARRKSGQLIMTDADIDGIATQVVIDTGSDTSIGNAALERALSRRGGTETVQLRSVTGQNATARLGLAHALNLGGMTLRNTMIAFVDAPPFARLGLRGRPALLLGMAQLRLFHRVAIDFATRRILFDTPAEAAAHS